MPSPIIGKFKAPSFKIIERKEGGGGCQLPSPTIGKFEALSFEIVERGKRVRQSPSQVARKL